MEKRSFIEIRYSYLIWSIHNSLFVQTTIENVLILKLRINYKMNEFDPFKNLDDLFPNERIRNKTLGGSDQKFQSI